MSSISVFTPSRPRPLACFPPLPPVHGLLRIFRIDKVLAHIDAPNVKISGFPRSSIYRGTILFADFSRFRRTPRLGPSREVRTRPPRIRTCLSFYLSATFAYWTQCNFGTSSCFVDLSCWLMRFLFVEPEVCCLILSVNPHGLWPCNWLWAYRYRTPWALHPLDKAHAEHTKNNFFLQKQACYGRGTCIDMESASL